MLFLCFENLKYINYSTWLQLELQRVFKENLESCSDTIKVGKNFGIYFGF